MDNSDVNDLQGNVGRDALSNAIRMIQKSSSQAEHTFVQDKFEIVHQTQYTNSGRCVYDETLCSKKGVFDHFFNREVICKNANAHESEWKKTGTDISQGGNDKIDQAH